MRALAVVLALTLSGCASYSRMASYEAPATYPVERVKGDAGTFTFRRHPLDSTVLITVPANGATFKAALLGDLTLGTGTVAAQAALRPMVMRAASEYAAGKGCTVTDLYQLDQMNWEARLSC